MVNYQYTIPLKMGKPSAVKLLNDEILSGKRKGYVDFLLQIKKSQTYSNVCSPIAGVLDYYRDLGFDFNIIYTI